MFFPSLSTYITAIAQSSQEGRKLSERSRWRRKRLGSAKTHSLNADAQPDLRAKFYSKVGCLGGPGLGWFPLSCYYTHFSFCQSDINFVI